MAKILRTRILNTKNRSIFPTILAGAFLSNAVSLSCAAQKEIFLPSEDLPLKPQGDRPNILYIMSDDHSREAISAYNPNLIKTPNIDRIANEGALLMNNTVCNSICGPSRATVLTGKHSHKNGFIDNDSKFNSKQQTFAHLLRDNGYATAIVGKWHLVSDPDGFDHWDIFPGQGNYYNPDLYGTAGARRINGYSTDITGDLAIEWISNHLRKQTIGSVVKSSKKNKTTNINENVAQPFMLMCHFKAPHRNWSPAPRHYNLYNEIEFPAPKNFFEDLESRPDYFKMNEMRIADHMMMDYDLKIPNTNIADALGRQMPNYEYMRMTLTQKKAWDAAYSDEIASFKKDFSPRELALWKYQRYMKDYLRTIAAVDENVGRLLDYLDATGLADNTIVVYASDQSFFLGEHGLYDKRWMYRESFDMPFAIRYPKKIDRGQKVVAVTQNIDVAPTFLEFAGVEIPSDIQGESLAGLLTKTRTFKRNEVYYHYYERKEHNVPRHEGVFDGRYKLISFYDYNAFELYDLQNDYCEEKNLWNNPAYASLQSTMLEKLEKVKLKYEVGK